MANDSAADPSPTSIRPDTSGGMLSQIFARLLTASIGLSNVITHIARLSGELFPPPSAFENASSPSMTRCVASLTGVAVYLLDPVASNRRLNEGTRVNTAPARINRMETAIEPGAPARITPPDRVVPLTMSQKATKVIQIVDCHPRSR